MDLAVHIRLYLLLLSLHYFSMTESQVKPTSPRTFYAIAGSTVLLPCIPGNSGDSLRWYVEHADDSLKSRSSSYKDKNDPDLLVHEIKNVRSSDAGTFVCSDGLETSDLELVVIEPSQVLGVQALIDNPEEIRVIWKPPRNSPELVKEYTVYVKEVAETGKVMKTVTKDEEYILTDFFPGSTYEIQVTPVYAKGDDLTGDSFEGPKSRKIRIKAPKPDRPSTPRTFYAIAGSTALLPCVAGDSKDSLRWSVERADDSLQSRSSSYKDKNDPDLFVHEIRNVQPSDAGTFVCSDGYEISSLDLVVIEPSQVLNVKAQTDNPDEVRITWMPPRNSPELVKRYYVYIKELGEAGKELKLSVNETEEYVLTDFSPGSTYDIQVSPVYIKGPEPKTEAYEGPKSQQIRVKAPQSASDASAWAIKAEPWYNSTVLVTWQPPGDVESRATAYIVHYQGIGKKDSPAGRVNVAKRDKDNRWSTVLKGLKTRMRYNIRVEAVTRPRDRVDNKQSPEVTVLHDGFNPELSIRAIPLGPETVLVTLDTVGGDKVDKLRILYSDDSAIKWNRVDGYNPEENFAVVTGLQPRTRYFFAAKATVNKKARSVITHVQTPPAGISRPTNISVEAKSENSVLVSWGYQGRISPKGFIVLVEKSLPDGSFSPDKHHVVFNENEVLVPDLHSDEQYQVKVEPFDVDGVGTCSDPVLFQLASATLPPPQPERLAPRILNAGPDRLEINAGEDLKLTCTAIGTPHPTVQWLRDGFPLTQPSDRVSELQLSGVEESIVVTCVASNSLGRVESITRVDVIPQIGENNPEIVPLPEHIIVREGQDIRQWCNATGYPVPAVTWYRNGSPVRSVTDSPARSQFVERRVTRPFDLKCVARNAVGAAEDDVKVYIQERLKNPLIEDVLPRSVEKYEGEELSIPCAFSGSPTPLVTWYFENIKLGESVVGRNILKINQVEKSGVLNCTGENILGSASELIKLIVLPKEATNPPVTHDFQNDFQVRSVSQSETEVKWAVNRGNLNDIRYFDITLKTDRGQTVVRERFDSQKRSITFRRLSPQGRYTVNVQTVTNSGVADNKTIEFIPALVGRASDTPDKRPVIYLSVVEIRDNSARLDFSSKNIDPQQFRSYRFRVKDLSVSLGNTILNREVPSLYPPNIAIDRLKPFSNYQVIIDVLDRGGLEFLTAVANFTTPGTGQYGTPVHTTSDATGEPASHPGEELQTTSTIPPTAAPITWVTSPTTERTTTISVTTTSTDEYTTIEPTDRPEDNDYRMTAKIPSKTPYRVDIRWTVDRGPIENIRDFTVTIKGNRGQTLLQQTLPSNQRYITIQSLSPDTNYFVNVKANGPDGTLAESDVAFKTDPANTVPDTSNPVLELEANEVRAHNARIDWTVINADPNLVKRYRLRVLDEGPGGTNLLTQELQANLQSLNLQQLQPNKRYHVIVDALTADGSDVLSASLTFETSSPNEYGLPVVASSASSTTPLQPRRMLEQRPAPDKAHSSKDSTRPSLELEINPEGASSARLTWNSQNVSPRAIREYILKVRNNDPEGTVLLERSLAPAVDNFKLDGLKRDRKYYIEVSAISDSGHPFLLAGAYYTPGASLTSRPSETGPAHREPTETKEEKEYSDDHTKPEIELELNPVGHDQVKVNWTVIVGSKSRPIYSYKIKINEDGPQGRNLHENNLGINTAYYTFFDLEGNKRYYVQLDALDRNGRIIEYVGHPYLVPPRGHSVEPIRTSSVFNKKPAAATAAPTRNPSESDLIITRAERQGTSSIILEWEDITASNGVPSRETIIRYATFAGNSRDNFRIQTVPAGQQRFIIPNINPYQTYGIQIASITTGGQYVRWSELVMVPGIVRV